ncbi:MAG: tail fiber domain-containing protein [Chitinophagaceae bacterium]|nr:tail fiber domain-containing protein [Chitinophagaceae bacterium]
MTLLYQVSGTAIDHAFFAATSPSTSIELMRIKGNGNIGIGNSNPLVPLSFPGVGGKKISLYPGGSGDAGMGIYPNEFRLFADNPNADITFGIDDYTLGFSEKIRFKANGNMGIGTSNPLVPLAFSNTLGNKIALYTNSTTSQYGMGVVSGLLQIYGDVISADIGFGYGSSSNFTERMRIKGTGFVGIGTSNPTQALHVVGNIFATGTITPSDARYKKNILLIDHPLEKLQQLNGVTYNYRQDEFPDMKFPVATQVGLIAQEVEKVYPQLVFTDDKGYKAVDYVKLIPLLIETAKAQQKQEETLQQKVNKQQEEIEALKILVEKILNKK